MRIAERMIVAPVVTGELSGYIPILCDQRRLTPHQGEALRRLLQGLQQTGARLANGKVIAHRSDVFPWVRTSWRRMYPRWAASRWTGWTPSRRGLNRPLKPSGRSGERLFNLLIHQRALSAR